MAPLTCRRMAPRMRRRISPPPLTPPRMRTLPIRRCCRRPRLRRPASGAGSPRLAAIFTALALYGAFGNVLIDAFHLPLLLAALAAVVPTLLVERFAVRPLWNLVFRFQAQPSASLDQLILGDAIAVVPFRNGRGIVSTNREGRIVQLRACLSTDQASLEVRVGDRLRIEDVDAPNERVTVSVLPRE